MKSTLYALTLFFLQFAWAQSELTFESETLKIIPINDKVLIHESYLNTESWGKVGCNGMVFISGTEAIVFDTPTDDQGSQELIDWLKNKNVTIKAVVATHFHEDCLGGINAFHKEGIISYANKKTLELLLKNEAKLLPQKTFEKKLKIRIGKEKAHISHFGEGHTSDNVVGYLPSEATLFGGCLIKSMKASQGNLDDANVEEWSATVANIKRKLPDLKTVIPGHGASGGQELLDYTIDMFIDN